MGTEYDRVGTNLLLPTRPNFFLRLPIQTYVHTDLYLPTYLPRFPNGKTSSPSSPTRQSARAPCATRLDPELYHQRQLQITKHNTHSHSRTLTPPPLQLKPSQYPGYNKALLSQTIGLVLLSAYLSGLDDGSTNWFGSDCRYRKRSVKFRRDRRLRWLLALCNFWCLR